MTTIIAFFVGAVMGGCAVLIAFGVAMGFWVE